MVKNLLVLFLLTASISGAYAQNNCNEALRATEGVNTIPLLSQFNYWYRFTMPQDGKLVVTSSTEQRLELRPSCEGALGVEFGNGEAVIQASENDEIFIKWDIGFFSEELDWNLSVDDLEIGDNCTIAAVAVIGSNAVPSTIGSKYWFEYTVANDNYKLQINSPNFESFRVFRGSCDGAAPSYLGRATLKDLSAGDKIFIEWATSYQDDFSWTLYESEITTGDECDLAEVATLGENYMPATYNQYYWFKYTVQSNDKKLVISSSENERITVTSGTCRIQKSIAEDFYGNIQYVGLEAGEIIFIKWRARFAGDFNWTIAETDIDGGDTCEAPETAIIGTNNLPSTLASFFWYTYIVVEDDKKLMVSSSSTESVTVFDGSCSSLIKLAEGYEGTGLTGLNAGDNILIRWQIYSGGDFNWQLAEVDLDSGDNCNLAEEAVVGANILPGEYSGTYWYSYKMPSNDKLIIDSSLNPNITIYKGSCTGLTMLQTGNGEVSTMTLTTGDQVYVKFSDFNSSIFNWELLLIDKIPGEDCTLPVSAKLGVNRSEGVPMWFSYTAPTKGEYVVSSVGSTETDTFLEIYDGCGQERIEYNDNAVDSQSELVVDLEKGQVLYVRWIDTHSSEAFDWTLGFNGPKVDQVITFNSLTDKVVGDGNFDLTASSSGGLSVSYISSNSDVATINGKKVTIVGLGTTTITASQAGNEIYNVATSVEQTLTINKENQTITLADIDDKLTTDATFEVTASASSQLAVSLSVEGPATLEGTMITLDGTEGTVTVIANQAGNDTFNSAPEVNTSFEVRASAKEDQTITLADITDKLTTDATFEVTASASSQLVVSFSVEGPATLEGTTITLDGTVGTVTVIANQAGNDEFNAAPEVATSFEVTVPAKEDQIMIFNAIEDQDLDVGNISLTATASSGLDVSYEVTGSATVEGSVLTFTGVGEVTVTASQTGNDSYNAAESVSQTFNVIAITATIDDLKAAQLKVYPNPSSGYIVIESQEAVMQVSIIDVRGEIVLEQLNFKSEKLDVSQLKSGVYFLTVETSKNKETLRISIN